MSRIHPTDASHILRKHRTGSTIPPGTIMDRANAIAPFVQRSWPLLLVTAIGLLTAFFRIGVKGLWGDEVWQVTWSQQQPWLQTFDRFRAPPDLPLHFLLTQMATSLGAGEVWDRVPSALLGAVTVVVLFLLSRRVAGTVTAFAASLLLAVAPYHVWYSQEARPYAAVAFYALLSLYFYWESVEAPRRWVSFGLAAATAGGIYNHLFGLFPVLVEVLATVAWAGAVIITPDTRLRRLQPVTATAAALSVGLLAAFPLYRGIATYLMAGGPGEITAPPFRLTPDFLESLFGVLGPGPGWSLILFAPFFVVGLVRLLQNSPWFALLAWAWLAVPLLVLLLSQPRHLIIFRYFLFMQPVYIFLVAAGLIWTSLAVGHGIARMNGIVEVRASQAVSWGAVGVLALITFVPTWKGYWVERVTDWSAICTYLHTHAQPGDAVMGDSYSGGIMVWCLKPGGELAFVPQSVPPRQVLRSGQNVWYVLIDGSSPFDTSVQSRFATIPQTAWARSDQHLALSDSERLLYPVAEHLATLYYRAATHVPRRITFHNVHPGGSSPDFIQIAQGNVVPLHLRLTSRAPRILRITYFDLSGRSFEVIIEGRWRTPIQPTGNGQWHTVNIPIPSTAPPTFLVELRAASSQIGAVSAIEVRHAP